MTYSFRTPDLLFVFFTVVISVHGMVGVVEVVVPVPVPVPVTGALATGTLLSFETVFVSIGISGIGCVLLGSIDATLAVISDRFFGSAVDSAAPTIAVLFSGSIESLLSMSRFSVLSVTVILGKLGKLGSDFMGIDALLSFDA